MTKYIEISPSMTPIILIGLIFSSNKITPASNTSVIAMNHTGYR